jgi:hypothetical protein
MCATVSAAAGLVLALAGAPTTGLSPPRPGINLYRCAHRYWMRRSDNCLLRPADVLLLASASLLPRTAAT